MPARKLFCAIVTVLLLTSACSDDSTSPEGTLTVEEILQVSQRMSEVVLSGLAELEDPGSGILGSGIEITFTGRLRYTAVNDGRNGTCDIDLVESSMRTTTEATFSWKGTVCGIEIDHSDQRP